MKRLYYLFSGTQPARAISDDLHGAGINDGQLHFLSKDSSGLQSSRVHGTTLLDVKDIPHTTTWGAIMGLGLGIVIGLYFMATDAGSLMTVSAFFLVCVMFTLMGAWVGGFIGMSMDNHHIARFHNAIEQGDTLLMVDTYNDEEERQFKQVMRHKHSEARFEGEEDNYRVFF